MLSDLLQDVSLFRILHQIDRDLAESCRQARCPYCQGSLHYAPYRRKPRGGPEKIPEEYLWRFSLCCGREDCRRRVLPPSCLFMGRRVYWQAVILVVMTLRQSRADGIGANRLMRMFSIPRKTIVRWIGYFRDEFAASREWLRLRGRVDATVGNGNLPGGLVEHFLVTCGSAAGGLVACLQFLATGQVS
jgi:hypothetical protein